MKIFGYALCAFVILSFGSAMAANDCCWDWDPKSNGADDGATAPPVKEVKESDYALCTATAKASCFSRFKRQMYWVNWSCDTANGANSPDGHPRPNTASSFYCDPKPTGADLSQLKREAAPVQIDDFFIETIDVPAVSTTGLIVLALLVLGGAAWMLRRRGAAPAAA